MCFRFRSALLLVLIITAWLFLSGTGASAQTSSNFPAQSLVAIEQVINSKAGGTEKFGLGDRISVEISGAPSAIQRATADPKKLVLLMDEVALRGLCTNAVVGGGATVSTNETMTSNAPVFTNLTARLQFTLERREANRADWTTLLGSPRAMLRPVVIEIGIEANNSISILSSNRFPMELVVLPNEPFFLKGTGKRNMALATAIITLALLVIWASKQKGAAVMLKEWVAWLAWVIILIAIYCGAGPTWCWAAFFTLFLVGFIYLALHTEMIRDSGPQPPEGKLRPYSLARTQMAIWFFLSISAFVFIWLMTSALDTITGTILALMGIGAGTALGAEAQNQGKLNKLKVEKQELEAKNLRTADEDCRLKRLQRITADVPCLLFEKEKLEGDLSLKRKALEKINGQLATEIVAMLNQERVVLDALGAGRTTEQNVRLAKIAAILALGSDKAGLVSALTPGAPIPNRIKEIDELLACGAEAMLNQEKAELDALGAGRTTPQNDRLAKITAMLALETERAGLVTALTPGPGAPIPSRIKEIDEILATRPIPISKDFFEDILTDDDAGISFHRFQMFVWTLVLGIIFIASVYRQLAMPEFNETLLALMGISSGTYMGFMIAEPKK